MDNSFTNTKVERYRWDIISGFNEAQLIIGLATIRESNDIFHPGIHIYTNEADYTYTILKKAAPEVWGIN